MKIKVTALDKLFSEYIRKRAILRVHGCERCLTGKTDYKQLQCSHFWGRGKRSVRHDEDNACGLCYGCHAYFTAHPVEHRDWFLKHLGEQPFDMLEKRAQTPQKIDVELITLYLKAKLRELEV